MSCRFFGMSFAIDRFSTVLNLKWTFKVVLKHISFLSLLLQITILWWLMLARLFFYLLWRSEVTEVLAVLHSFWRLQGKYLSLPILASGAFLHSISWSLPWLIPLFFFYSIATLLWMAVKPPPLLQFIQILIIFRICLNNLGWSPSLTFHIYNFFLPDIVTFTGASDLYLGTVEGHCVV